MASLEELRALRLQKAEALRQKGENPYPSETSRTHTVSELLSLWSKLQKKKKIILSGRIRAIRGQGGLIFFNLDDGTGSFQGALQKGDTPEEALSSFAESADVGDFIEAEGSLFLTKRGEKTLLVKRWKMLVKSLRPLPDKWHGLQDTEERFRRRYLDLVMDGEVKERFLVRSRIISGIRQFLEKDGFVEVETPMFQPLYGGASAVPFTTHYKALETDFYLRISPELYLKRLMAGGMPKVFELNRNFRNEGIDVTHSPEFTMLEFYAAYETADSERVFVEKMLKTIVKKVLGNTQVKFEDTSIDFSKKFAVVSYFDLFKRFAGLNSAEKMKQAELEVEAKRLGAEVAPGDNAMKILDNIYKKHCRPKLIQPTFIIDYPAEMLPLAKRKIDNPELVDAFQLIIGGMEMVKAFSELNDPIDQRARFEEQEKSKKLGDKEAQSLDEDFLECMEYGIPPAGGVGIGIDRLTMLLTNVKNIREVILFPTLKPKS